MRTEEKDDGGEKGKSDACDCKIWKVRRDTVPNFYLSIYLVTV